MRLGSALAAANAALAFLCALVGAAPFTPAIVFFFAFAPLAALFSAMGRTTASLWVPIASIIGWLLSPLRESRDSGTLQLVWIAWVAAWSACTLYFFFRPKLFARLVALKGGGNTGPVE